MPKPKKTKSAFHIARGMLSYLGRLSPPEIARFLRSKGIKGNHDCTSCPIAVWLRPKVGRVKIGRWFCEVAEKNVYLPESVQEFIHEYDREDKYGYLYPGVESHG